MENMFYMSYLSTIGGTESFFYYLAKKYHTKDITFVIRTGNYAQVERLEQYARVIQWDGKEKFQCKRLFCNYFTDILDYVEAEEYIQVLHTDYKEQYKNIAMTFTPDPRITKYIGVSKIVCEHFTEMTGLPCELCYNPIIIDKPKKVLNLISATRLSLEKGKDRMVKLGEALDKANIPYLWLIFTNDSNKIQNKHIIYMQTELDITPYIANADYLVQLSNNGEGFGYTPAEALMVGTPVIVTPCDSFKEIGVVDGVNGIVLDFDMNNIDTDRIYNSEFNFKYNPPKDMYNKLLGNKKSNYINDNNKQVVVRVRKEVGYYWDTIMEKTIYYNDGEYIVNKKRAKKLIDAGVCEIIREIDNT